MKILFVNEILGGGGKERRLIQIAEALVEHDSNLQLYIILEKKIIDYPQVLQNRNIHIRILSSGNNWNVLREYIKVLNEIKPDIVQCWSEKSAFYFSFLNIFYRYTLISSFIADCLCNHKFANSLIRRFVYQKSKYVIGNSKAGLKDYNSPSDKSFVIYNTYDLNRLKKIKERQTLKDELRITTKYIVLMVGSVSRYKDYDTFLHIAENTIKKRQDITFLAVGKGNELANFQNKVKGKSYISFLGFREDVDSLINMSDICLLCTFSEGISNFLIESMMQKKAVIATGIGGTKEIIINNQTGFLYSQPDVEEITNQISLLLDQNEEYNRVAMEGYNYIKNLTNSENSVNKYLMIYNSIYKK